MKYQSKKNNNTEEIISEEIVEENANDSNEEEVIEEVTEKKSKGFFKRKKQEYEIIEDEDDEEDNFIKEEKSIVEENKEEPVEEKVEEEQSLIEEPTLKIEPIRTVSQKEYTDIAKKREKEKEKQEKKKNKKEKKSFKLDIRMVINALFLLIIILIAITVVDIVSVSKYNQGPYFAINTKTYKDGGTKVYYGIGYKVIKYNQLQGRKDMEIGTWSLKYNVEPITVSDIDLSIEFTNKPKESFERYYKRFVRINSTLKQVNSENNLITIGYENKEEDEKGKYTMDIICTMAKEDFDFDSLEVGKETTIIGTVIDFKEKTSKAPITLSVSDCYAEQ